MSESAYHELSNEELALAILGKLSAVDTMLSQTFKTHVPVNAVPVSETPREIMLAALDTMDNLGNFADSLRNTNPMVLVKQLMGL
jgi:hypothetical protein